MSEVKKEVKETLPSSQEKPMGHGSTSKHSSPATSVARSTSSEASCHSIIELASIVPAGTDFKSSPKIPLEEKGFEKTMNTHEFQTTTTIMKSGDTPETTTKKKASMLNFAENLNNCHSSSELGRVASSESFTNTSIGDCASLGRLPASEFQHASVDDEAMKKSLKKCSVMRIHHPSAVMVPPASPPSVPPAQVDASTVSTNVSRLLAALHSPETKEVMPGATVQAMDGTFQDRHGLRMYPSSLTFHNVFEGERRLLRFVLQNISTRPIKISVNGPSSVFFSLEHPIFRTVLAPGLCHHDTITLQTFSSHAEGSLSTTLSVTVDGHNEIYNIETNFAAPQLEVEPPELDFGTVNLGAPVRVQTLTLRNKGALVGNFAVDHETEHEKDSTQSSEALELDVRPTRGKVHAHKEVLLRCELAPTIEGDFQRMIWVRSADMALHVPVHVNVVRPRLELLYPPAPAPVNAQASPSKPKRHRSAKALRRQKARVARPLKPAEQERVSFALIDFGSTYFGTNRRLVATVRSCSADICTFVVLAEMRGEQVMSMKKARDENPNIKVFRANPKEGRIESFETRILTFGFDPQLWVNEKDGRLPNMRRDFLLFLRVIRVLCVDLDHKPSAKATEPEERYSFASGDAIELRRQELQGARNNEVRLCLHGQAVPVTLAITPTALPLGSVALGTCERRVLRFTNLCTCLPLQIRVARPTPPGVHVEPTHGTLEPSSSFELTVFIAPVSFGKFQYKLRWELLGRSEPLLADVEMASLGFRNVPIEYNCPAVMPTPPPRVALGLSPIINREVGVIGDGVPFCSTAIKPRMAMLRSDLRNQFLRTTQPPALVARVRGDPASEVYQKAPPSTPDRETCGQPCDPVNRPCCQSCYRPQIEDWSSSGSSSSDEERRGEPSEAAAAAAEVERLLVPDVPRIACGVVMEPIAENAQPGEAPRAREAADARSSNDVVSTDVLAASDDRLDGCVIGNLLDAVVQARDSSSTSTSAVSSDWSPSGDNRAFTDYENTSQDPTSGTSGNGFPSSEDIVPTHVSSEKLLRVTEFTNAVAPHANNLHTDQPQQKQTNNVGNSSTPVKKISSAMLVDLGGAGGSGDKVNFRVTQTQKSSKTQQGNSTVSTTSKKHMSPVVSALESTQQLQKSSVNAQDTQYFEINKITKTLKHTSTGTSESSYIKRKSTLDNIGESTNLEKTQRKSKLMPEKKAGMATQAQNDNELFKSRQPLKPITSLVMATPIDKGTSAFVDEAKRVYPASIVNEITSKRCERTKPARLLKNKITPELPLAKKYAKPLKEKFAVLAKVVSTKNESSNKLESSSKSTTATVDTSHFDMLPLNPTAKAPVVTNTTAMISQNVGHIITTQAPDAFSKSQEHEKRNKKKHNSGKKKKEVEKDSDDDDSYDDGLRDARGTPESLGPATHRENPPPASSSDLKAEALEAISKDTRCEALRWARGQQLHPHCPFIAFPNDMAQRSVRPWPSNRLTRSIFTGAPRYVAPIDEDETLKPKEVLTLKEREEMARLDIRNFAWQRRAHSKQPMPDDKETCNVSKCVYPFHPDCMDEELMKAEKERRQWLMPAQDKAWYLQTLVPLTPTQLFNVRLKPAVIDYGTVGMGSKVKSSVMVHNGNHIPVKVNASTTLSTLTVAGHGEVYVKSEDSAEMTIILEPTTLGRFNGMLRYIVNNCHVFEAPVTGEVVLRSLRLPVNSLRFGILRGPEECFPQVLHVIDVENPLQVPCKFEWLAVDRTCYDITPRKGEVPAMGTRACEVTYCANLEAQTPDAALLLASESDNYLQLNCHFLVPNTIPAGFVRPVYVLPDMSLLRRKVSYIYLYNASYLEILFRVEENNKEGDAPDNMSTATDFEGTLPCHNFLSSDKRVSWQIRPSQGSMRPRSLRRLYLTTRALAPGPVNFQVRVFLGLDAHAPPTSQGSLSGGRSRGRSIVQQHQVLETTVTSFVAYPNVLVSPTELRIRRVPTGSEYVEHITLQNVGSVEASLGMAQVEDFGPNGEWRLSLNADREVPVPMPLLLQPQSPPVHFYILFRPVEVASYDFLVPFLLNGGIGPPIRENPKTMRADFFVPGDVERDNPVNPQKLPCLHVDATSARGVVTVSETKFDFHCSASDPSSNVTRQVLEVKRMSRKLSIESTMSFTLMEDANGNRTPSSFSDTALLSGGHSILQDNVRLKDVSYLWTPLSCLKNTPFSLAAVSGGALTELPRVMACTMTKDELQSKLKYKMKIDTKCSDVSLKVLGTNSFSPVYSNVYVTKDREEDENGPLFCSPLGSFDSSLWEIIFQPKERGTFTTTLPVYFNEFAWSTRPLLHLQLTGVNEGPSFSVLAEEVCLPPRPINVPSEAKILLEAWNFQQETNVTWSCENLQCELGSPPKDCLQMVFIKTLVSPGPHVTRLTGTVVFKSPKSIGIRARIVLSAVDDPEVKCSFRVTALADYSLLSTHIFLRSHKLPYDDHPWGRPVSPGGVRRSKLGRGRYTQFVPPNDDDGNDDWPSDIKSLQSLVSPSVSFVETSQSGVEKPAATAVAVTIALDRTSAESVSTVGADSKHELGLPEPTEGELSLERRRRGSSRCAVDIATISPEMDSLMSSEDEEVIGSDDEEPRRIPATPNTTSEGNGFSVAPTDSVNPHLYPEPTDLGDYAIYCRRLNQAVEEWMYDVCFRREYWASLPSGLNECYRLKEGLGPEMESQAETPGPDRRKKTKLPMTCPFRHDAPLIALRNIAGPLAADLVLGRNPRYYSDESFLANSVPDRVCDPRGSFKKNGTFEIPRGTEPSLQCYATFLHMLRSNGAVLPHVRPEYLIDYSRYSDLYPSVSDMTQENFKPETSNEGPENDAFTQFWSPAQLRPKVSPRVHRNISHMAWIDVLLQMARTFWLPKIDEEHANILDLNSSAAEEGLDIHSRYNVASAANHSVEELFLLAWMNEHYERMRLVLCPQSPKPPEPRKVANFDEDLTDSLVLAAVTIDICPYLKQYTPDLFAVVTTREEAEHNAARLISAWGAIRLGFAVCVRDLVQPLSVKMLLLVAYLYNVLPSLNDSQQINISARLSSRGETSLSLVNPSRQRLFYLAEFIGDTGGFFSAMAPGSTRVAASSGGTATIFPIHPGHRVNINVNFHARTFKKKSCTLVMTGNIYASYFGRPVAFHLEGEPSSLDVSVTLHVSSTLYRPTNRKLKLPLPYNISPQMTLPIEFDLYLQEKEPQVNNAFLGCTWEEKRTHKVLRRLSLNQSRMLADQDEVPSPKETVRKISETKGSVVKMEEPPPVLARLNATICAFTPFTRYYWIGCVHPTFGDFIVKVVSRPNVGPPLATLKLPLPADWTSAKCTCGGRMSLFEGMNTGMLCPLITQVMVPSRNAALWSAVVSMFETTLDDVERAIWKRYLDSPIGVRLVQWVLEKDEEALPDEYDHIFNSTATYDVVINSSHVHAASEFIIPDLLSTEMIPLKVHVDNQTPYNLRTRMKLTSMDQRELRVYSVVAEMSPNTIISDEMLAAAAESTTRSTLVTTTDITEKLS